MVSIVVQNLVEIDAVVSITWNFQYFARLAWKRLFTPQKLGFSGDFTPEMRSNVNKTPKGTSLRESASFEPSSVKIRRRVWTVGEFMKKRYKLKKNSLYFTYLPRSPPSTDLHQIWRRRNHLYQIFGDRSRGVYSVGGRKLPSPIDKASRR